MTITTPRGPIPLLRIHVHLQSVINKVASEMMYQGSKHQSDMMQMMGIIVGSLQNILKVHISQVYIKEVPMYYKI